MTRPFVLQKFCLGEKREQVREVAAAASRSKAAVAEAVDRPRNQTKTVCSLSPNSNALAFRAVAWHRVSVVPSSLPFGSCELAYLQIARCSSRGWLHWQQSWLWRGFSLGRAATSSQAQLYR